jgi:hypothetical protein
VNISGGSVGNDFTATLESTVNVSGGTIGQDFDVSDESSVSVSGGSFIEQFRVLRDSTAMISGGTFSDGFRVFDTSTVSIYGSEFRSDGELISGLNAVGDAVFYSQPGATSLTGTFAGLYDQRLDRKWPGNSACC